METNLLQDKLERVITSSAKVARRATSLEPIAYVVVNVYADDLIRQDLKLSVPVFRALGGGFLSVLEDMFSSLNAWLVGSDEFRRTVDMSKEQRDLINRISSAVVRDGQFSFNIISLIPLLGGLKTSVPVIYQVVDVVAAPSQDASEADIVVIKSLHSKTYHGDASLLNKDMLTQPEAMHLFEVAQKAMEKKGEIGTMSGMSNNEVRNLNW